MKILAVHPGASFSTHDVYVGYRDALADMGHEVIEYRLDHRLEVSQRYLRALLNYTDRDRPRAERRKPTSAQVQWEAGSQIVNQALWHKVDFVLNISLMYTHPDYFVLLRRARVPNVAILTESPYTDEAHERLLPYIDVAFVNERSSVARLGRINADVSYLPPAYDPRTHHPGPHLDDRRQPAHDVVFVGTGFPERVALLAGVDWSDIDLGLYGTWDMLPSRHPLRRYVRGGVTPNHQAAALYRRARIGLNLYRTTTEFRPDAPHIAHAESLNPRAVELAACGAFHLSDRRAEVAEVFGDTVPTFADAAGLASTIRSFLADEAARRRLAARLPGCVRGWTFRDRAEALVSTLRAAWSGASTARSA